MDLHQFVKSSSIKPENMIKLVLSGIIGLVCIWGTMRYPQVRETAISPRALMVFGIIFLTILGATSLTTLTSVPTSLIILIQVWFVMLSLIAIGFRAYSFAIILGSLAYIGYGLFLYHFVPERGVFLEPISMTETYPRLGGVGHPNSVAKIAMLGMLLCFYLYRVQELKWWWCVGLIAVFVYAAFLSKSRTAMLAGVIGIIMLYSDSWRSRRLASFMIAGCMLLGLGFFAASLVVDSDALTNSLINKISKSGTTEELFSGTGRTEIWSEAWNVCMQRPLLGYGFNASTYLLEIMSPHNSVLYCFLSGGIFAALLMLTLHCMLVWDGFTSPNLAIRGLAMFYAVNLVVEDTMFETVPSQTTMLCIACFIYPAAVVSYRWAVTTEVVPTVGSDGPNPRSQTKRPKPNLPGDHTAPTPGMA